MCGIVGMIGMETNKTFPLFHNLLFCDVIRGADSTGIIAVNENFHPRTYKNIGTPDNLLWNKAYCRKVRFNKKDSICLVGHNRAATVGSISTSNAHPFWHKNIIMVHNGTINNKKEIEADYDGEFDTDSEAICWSIAEKGIDETWKLIQGAATIVYWDARNHTLNLITNGKRPFSFGYTEGRSRLIFGSELWMLKGLTDRHGLKMEEWSEPNNHFLFTFRYDKKTFKVVEDARKLEEPPYRAASSSHALQQWGHWGWYGDEKANDFKPGIKKDNVVPIMPQYDENDWDMFNRKKTITYTEFHNIYERCHSCGNSLADDYETALIVDDKKALCESCADIAEKENMSPWF